jgi:hypothetical protein
MDEKENKWLASRMCLRNGPGRKTLRICTNGLEPKNKKTFRLITQKIVLLFYSFFLCINPSLGNDSLINMFRVSMRDPTMQYLAREYFSDTRVAATCSVLALQWRSGRISDSTPDRPGDVSVPVTMHGMAEVTLFILSERPKSDVDLYVQRALRQFENSVAFRERAVSVCTELMIPMIRFTMQKNNIIQ